MVWSFLTAAGSLVDELDKEDEVKLLRLRTKKNELVIVPGTLLQYSLCEPLLTQSQTPNSFSSLYTTPLRHDQPNDVISMFFIFATSATIPNYLA
jgi:hypothetical protein